MTLTKHQAHQEPARIRLSEEIQRILRCARCRAELRKEKNHLICENPECGLRFPIVDGVPVLINDERSIFSVDSLTRQYKVLRILSGKTKKKKTGPVGPRISKNLSASDNFDTFAECLRDQSKASKVLIVGGKVLGQGIESLLKHQEIALIESDIAFGPRTQLICDASDIPFADGAFDGVIAQAVLEHVADPYRCVEEIHRILDENGVVYAETAFMQQVHGGRFDFTRFTFLGHRRLFRGFDEIDSGMVCGPGMSLASSYKYFLLSFSASRALRQIVTVFSHFTSFFLKYLDYYLIKKPQALDAASAYYFLGKRSDQVLTDRELIRIYGSQK